MFDRAFAVFWEHAEPPRRRRRRARAVARSPSPSTTTTDDDDEPGRRAEPSDDPTIELRFSATEVLRHKDFAAYDDDELAEAHRLMRRLRLAGRRAARCAWRRRPRRTARPDLRRTVRAALRTGGEPCAATTATPATRHRRLVLLLDVSGSMEPYARALLRFVHAAVAGRRRVEAFALGHPADPPHPGARLARPRPRAAPGRRSGRRLVGRHPARRRACAGSTTSGACGAWPAAPSS